MRSTTLWDRLPEPVRERVDAEVVQRQLIRAVRVIRESGIEPVPGLAGCQILIAERTELLADRLVPLPPRDPDTLAARVGGLPRPPVAFEAVWDGDTQGWIVDLLAILADPWEEVPLASIRGLEQSDEATATGRELAARFRVPFHFASPGEPDDRAPRWWDGRR
ncbi:hypothetical protein GCM10020367_15320 [Streptomyces sannanensis]|uniref:Uncharacterized protein n=1 Tax=Streptomyces sannanensis TaxID=285536 RepID=A0ABP6S8L9_9ACTN